MREGKELIETGAVLILMSLVVIIIVMFSKSASSYMDMEEKLDSQKELIREQASDYVLLHGSEIKGSDIIAFIMKNSANFDYVITFTGHTAEITAEKAGEKRAAGEDYIYMWSMEYLNDLFGNAVYSHFEVTKETTGHRSCYLITEK